MKGYTFLVYLELYLLNLADNTYKNINGHKLLTPIEVNCYVVNAALFTTFLFNR